MRENSGKSSTLYAEIKGENKDRIQNGVQDGADQNSVHADCCEPLGSDISIKAQRDLNENSSKTVDLYIIHGISDGIFTGAKGEQKWAGKNLQKNCEDN